MLWIFLIITLGGIKKEGEINFHIRDAYTGIKVKCEIRVLKDNNLLERVQADGEYKFLLPEGKYNFYFYENNHSPLETYFSITPNEKLNVMVYLTPLKKETLFPQKRKEITGIRGYVTDEKGNPLNNVEVWLKGKNLKTFTDIDGIFEFWIKVEEREYESLEDIPRDTIVIELKGYKVVKREILLIPENFILKIKMEKGEGEQIIPEIRGKGTGEEYIQPEKNIDNLENMIEENILRTFLDPPPSIRVGHPCNCWTCYDVYVMDLEYYVASGLDDEWIASWAQHSLRAGSVAYRSYGAYYVNNPGGANFDICDNACCQVWDGNDIYQSCIIAAHITNGILLEYNGSFARSEYSAENNNCGCGDGYSGTGSTWPCIYDPLCAGYPCYGHGRGMCQWGTSRWAQNGKYWKWIVNHYYQPGNMEIATPMLITSSLPSPNTVFPGDTFTIYYDVSSYCDENHENILLGASIYSSGTGFISDPENDLMVTIIPGAQTVSRIFAVPSSTPPGTYDLYTALWLDVDDDGKITGNDLDLYLLISYDAIIIQPLALSEDKLPPNFKLISEDTKKFGWLKILPDIAHQNINLTFSIPRSSEVCFEIIDVQGKKIKRIFKRYMKRGIYTYNLTTQFLKPGIYFLFLESKKEQSIEKVEIIR